MKYTSPGANLKNHRSLAVESYGESAMRNLTIFAAMQHKTTPALRVRPNAGVGQRFAGLKVTAVRKRYGLAPRSVAPPASDRPNPYGWTSGEVIILFLPARFLLFRNGTRRLSVFHLPKLSINAPLNPRVGHLVRLGFEASGFDDAPDSKSIFPDSLCHDLQRIFDFSIDHEQQAFGQACPCIDNTTSVPASATNGSAHPVSWVLN